MIRIQDSWEFQEVETVLSFEFISFKEVSEDVTSEIQENENSFHVQVATELPTAIYLRQVKKIHKKPNQPNKTKHTSPNRNSSLMHTSSGLQRAMAHSTSRIAKRRDRLHLLLMCTVYHSRRRLSSFPRHQIKPVSIMFHLTCPDEWSCMFIQPTSRKAFSVISHGQILISYPGCVLCLGAPYIKVDIKHRVSSYLLIR